MNAATQTTNLKITTQEVQEKIGADKCSFCKGVYTAKWLYYYIHGNDVEGCEAKILKAFPNAMIIKSSPNQDSWFEVIYFYLNEVELVTAK